MLPIIIDNSMRTTDGSCSNSLIWKFSAISYQQGWTDIKTGAPCHALSFASATLVSEAKIELIWKFSSNFLTTGMDGY